MINYAAGQQTEIECQNRFGLSSATRLALFVEESLRASAADVVAVERIYEQASELTPDCDWRHTAEDLASRPSAIAKWLAAALFESGGDFLRASASLDSFACPSSQPAEVLRLLAQARTLTHGGNASAAVFPLKRAIRMSESYRALNACGRVLRLLENPGGVQHGRTCRLAMLGNATFDLVLPVLRTVAFAGGIELVTYNGAYNQHMQEVFDDSSQLRAFCPDVIVFALDWRSLSLPEVTEDPHAILATSLAGVTNAWHAVASRFHCHVIQHNFVVPEVSPYGGLSGRLPGGRTTLIRELNLQLVRAAATRSDVSILDVDQVASLIGKLVWDDTRMWIAAKQYPAVGAVGMLAAHEVALLRAVLGLSQKCLVLDLDNTLWGGIIGEDGLDGIRLGGDPEGEAYVAFQRYVKGLHDRGIILAVCSKNGETDAKLPFEKHPEMVLKLEDISLFVANWLPKAENLRSIATSLNIGIESLVLVDDNPMECEQVRKTVPNIEVLELPADPALYVDALHRAMFFESLTVTREDSERADSYRANVDREKLQQSSTSIEEYLNGLQIFTKLSPFDQPNLPRIVQLINKTNQFNLTTQRMTADQVWAFAETAGNYTQFMHLRDRFGDSGITGVLMASPEGDALSIRAWLISCRVLGRRIEDAMLAAVWNFSRSVGYKALRGIYIPTAKNQQVANLYDRLGFDLVGEGEGGERYFRAELTSERQFPRFFEVEDCTGARRST